MEIKPSIWQGMKVRLRGIEPEDWPFFFEWNSDTESARTSYFIPFPKSAHAEQDWVLKKAMQGPQDDAYHFIIERLADGRAPVGSINTHSCNRQNGTFSYGVAVRQEHQGSGYASEAIRLLLNYFFLELGYRKCTVYVYAFNPASIRLHEKLGFTAEGRLRKQIYTNGEYHDELIFGLLREEFNKLG